MRRFLIKLLIIIVPVSVIVAGSNYFIDPANLFFPRKYVAGIVTILLKGHNVSNISNYDERLLQEQMITGLHRKPDIVVLGSSRVMEIGSDFFPGKTVLNVGVSHANIYDIVAITGILDSTGHLPAEVYINVDAGLISKKHTLEWQSIAPYYTSFIKNHTLLGMRPGDYDIKRTNKLYVLFSFEYFKESMRYLFTNGSKKYHDTGKNKPEKYGRFSDGTICYSNAYMHPDTIKTASDAAITGAKEGLTLPDQDNIQLLNILVDFFQQHSVKVHFIILPYHPAYYEAVNRNYDNLFSSYNAVFHAIAIKKQVDLNGSFDSNVYSLNQKDFYDMHHCSKDAIKRIINN